MSHREIVPVIMSSYERLKRIPSSTVEVYFLASPYSFLLKHRTISGRSKTYAFRMARKFPYPFRFSIFRSTHQWLLQPKTIIQAFLPIAVMGNISGFFPVKIFPNFRSPLKWKTTIGSVAYSVLFNLALHLPTNEVFQGFVFANTGDLHLETDKVALRIFFLAFFTVRYIIQFLITINASKLSQCLAMLSAYDKKFQHVNKTTVLDKSGLLQLVCILMAFVLTVAFSSARVCKLLAERDFVSTKLLPSPMMLTIFWAAHGVAEIALVSGFIITSFFLNAICDRIDQLARKIYVSDHFCYAMIAGEQAAPVPMERHYCMNAAVDCGEVSKALLELMGIKAAVTETLKRILLSIVTGSWVTLITMVHLLTVIVKAGLNLEAIGSRSMALTCLWATVLAVLRLLAVANDGEKIEASVNLP